MRAALSSGVYLHPMSVPTNRPSRSYADRLWIAIVGGILNYRVSVTPSLATPLALCSELGSRRLVSHRTDSKDDILARYASEIRFECPCCGAIVEAEIAVPETYWSGDNADERFVEDDADAECDSCRTGFGLHVQNSDGFIAVSVPGYDEVKVTASQAWMVEPDGPEDWDLPSEPAMMIQMTLEDVRTVLKSSVPSFHTATLLRMAFIQQFAVLEAYLSDTLIIDVLNKPGALARLIAGDEDLKKMKLPLDVIHGNPGIVAHTAATHLRGLLYHNFPKISAIWEQALGFHLFPDADIKERMMKAGSIRHDCVHRNGKDKDGNVRGEVDDGFLRQVDTDIRAMVDYIETQLQLVR